MSHTPPRTLPITAALAWEYWANGWRGILLAPLGAMALPGVIFGLLSWEHGAQPRDPGVGNVLNFGFYWIALVMLGASAYAALGNPARRYTLPASSLTLVAVPMACAMLTLFVEYVVVALALNALFGAGWAIWGPGLLAAVLIAWCQAVFWTTSSSGALQFLCGLASCAPLALAVRWWASSAYGLSMAGLTDVGVGRGFSFGLATVFCCAVGAFSFGRLRHGAGIDGKRIFDWLSARFRFWSQIRSAPFPSPTSAQFWLEWTERGQILPAVIVLVGIAVSVLAWFIPTTELPDFVRGISGFFFAPLFVIGIFWGNRSRLGEYGNFNGSRPLSDRLLANAILKSATLGLICSTLIWAASMGLVVLIAGEDGDVSNLHHYLVRPIGALSLLARVALGAIATWSAVCAVASFALGGNKVFGVAFGFAMSVVMAAVLTPLGLRHEYRPAFAQIYSFTCIFVCLLVTIAVFLASWRLRLISGRTLWLAAVLVLGALALSYGGGLTREWKYALPVLCGCGLTPFPLAAAPLAVYANRHR